MPGVRRLGRKRFAEAVKYLKAVVADKTKSDRMRMQAVESLIAIYDRNDRTLAQYEARRKAQEASQDSEQPTAPEQAHETPEEAADRIITAVRNRGTITNG